MTVVRGVCLCQIVGFEVDLAFIKFVKCHGSRCRKVTGSAFAANAHVLPSAFRWTRTRSGREVIIPAGALIDDPGVSPSIESCWSSPAARLSDAINLPTTD